jgi:hypothetical protein
MLFPFSNVVFAQYVSNVHYTVGNDVVAIYYDLSVTSDVSVKVSFDKGQSYSKDLLFVDGAVGENVLPGRNLCVVWHIQTDSLPDNMMFKVSAKRHEVRHRQKSFRPYSSVVGGVNFDFSPRFRWEGIGGWIGYMRRVGIYFNFLSNWWPNKSKLPFPESYTFVDYERKRLRRSYDVGLLVRTCEPLTIKIGCGYGKYKEFALMKDPNDFRTLDWFYNPETSLHGFEFNLGFLFHINWLNLSLEANAINFKHYDIRMGFGFSIDL